MKTAKKVRAAMLASGGRNRLVSFRFIGISEKHEKMHRLFGALPLWQQWAAARLVYATALFANRVLPGYVAPNDAGKYDLVFDHDGPASYTANGGAGGFITGGDTVNALDVGMSGFESVGVDSVVNAPSVTGGPFGAVVVEVKLGGAATGIPLGASALASLTLFYFQSPTRGTEFSTGNNLSSAFVRLRVMCV